MYDTFPREHGYDKSKIYFWNKKCPKHYDRRKVYRQSTGSDCISDDRRDRNDLRDKKWT